MIKKIAQINERIKKAAISCGRDADSITLVAVSKTMPAEKIKKAIDAGVLILGENYIQEARKKINSLSSFPVSWHFIGHLQTNKAKYAVRLFDLIHTVDSYKLAHELNMRAKQIGKIQQVLIQVNISNENSKSGVLPEDTISLIKKISMFDNISVKGLMAIPPFFNNPVKARPYFRSLRELKNLIKKENIQKITMETLSMGMTGDFEVAIEEGATLVRIGTAIFGERN